MDADVLARAAEIIRAHKLCNHCLGRLFMEVDAKNNTERGKAIREALGEQEPETCEMCMGFFKRADEIAWRAAEQLASSDARTILVSSKVPEHVLKLEEELWGKYEVKQSESIKKDINRTIGERLREIGEWRYDPDNPDAQITVDLKGNVAVELQPLYITANIVTQPPKKGTAKEQISVASEAIFGTKSIKLRTKSWKEGQRLVIEIIRPLRRHVSIATFAEALKELGVKYVNIEKPVNAECARKYLEGRKC
ncbi:MAG: hypothetical protein GXN93_02660 [Candidatus Diapherotrites archaeon]|nr:hypothetical protein [Candidatus Diapherotrites archaeon]